jgi:hypothetical protein
MTHDRHPSAAFWITVALIAVLVGYPLSFGPACWWLSKPVTLPFVSMKAKRVPAIYSPIGRLARRAGTGRLQTAINWYATVGVASGEGIACGIQDGDDPGIVFVAR